MIILRRSFYVLPLSLLAILGGCESLVNPYISAERQTHSYAESDPFPELRKSAENAETIRQKVLRYRAQHVITRSVLSYGIFGAATAGGVAALYGAHRDLVLGLGLGATGGYVAGSLFIGQDIIDIYSAAGRALNCAVSAADGAGALGKSLTNLTAPSTDGTSTGGTYWRGAGDLDILLKGRNWSKEEQSVKDAHQALIEYNAALANFDTFKALDFEFSSSVDRTVGLILDRMEQQIAAVRPNLDAVLRAAEGIGGLGVAYVKRVAPLEDEAAEEARSLERAPTPQDRIALGALTSFVRQSAVAINEKLINATNRLGRVGTLCVLDAPAIAPLNVSQRKISIGKDQTVVLVATGGKLPLTYVWQGETPGRDQIEVSLSSGRDIFLFGKAALPENKNFVLLIRDSLPAPGEIEIEVTTP